METLRAETITYEISVRFWQGDESDADFSELKDRVRKNFEKAKFVSDSTSEAKILDVKIIKEK